MITGEIMILCEEMYKTLSKAGLANAQLTEKYESTKASYKEMLLEELDRVVEMESSEVSQEPLDSLFVANPVDKSKTENIEVIDRPGMEETKDVQDLNRPRENQSKFKGYL